MKIEFVREDPLSFVLAPETMDDRVILSWWIHKECFVSSVRFTPEGRTDGLRITFTPDEEGGGEETPIEALRVSQGL